MRDVAAINANEKKWQREVRERKSQEAMRKKKKPRLVSKEKKKAGEKEKPAAATRPFARYPLTEQILIEG